MSKQKNTTEIMENESVQDVAAEVDAASEPTINGNGDSPVTEPNNSEQAERILQLEQELHNALQAKDEYYNRLLRIQADFDNFRRRSKQEYEQICLCAGEDLIKKILPVVDSLERAVSCFTDSSDNCSWQDGVQLTLKQFKDILKSEGVEPVASLNEAFDPLVHEAVMQEHSETVETPTIVAELQKGYKYKNKLLRPALVKVAVPIGG
jgi:molecular chaperone GrpE